jgi:hypothetical protein
MRGQADAALAASLFHYGELDIGDLKMHLHRNGVPVRLPSPPIQDTSVLGAAPRGVQ